ncbi:MAG: glycosyltransferase family 39 protein [Lentimicrobiaceae bacterium]|nr:glycosyltransferase family 39 protein [Lentimicrobiaceae bacterium]
MQFLLIKMWKNIIAYVSKHPSILIAGAILILIPALFINLGLLPLISDEPTRAVVALEMTLSGNFIHPTIMGEYYYNKPPLYNWILIAFYWLTGNMNEFTLRLPTVLSLLAYAWVVFNFSKPQLGKYFAALAALFTITSARILFWDSSHALIDITYALLTFSSFVLLYRFTYRKQFTALFTTTYTLTALGFLMKGIPSLAFQAISLLVWLIVTKNFKKLFSFSHALGIFIFLAITGSYYFAFLQSNSIYDALHTLISESNRLEGSQSGITGWLLHLISFPFEMMYEFAPWSLLILLLFKKSIRNYVFNHPFYRFCAVIFLSNIIIYWISADMRARYLFMLFPLVFILGAAAYRQLEKESSIWLKATRLITGLFITLGLLSLWLYPFWDETCNMTGVITIAVLSSALIILSFTMVIQTKKHHLLSLIIVLLLIRISFNLFNLPARLASTPDRQYRDDEVMAGQLTRDLPVYVWETTPFNHDAAFYVGRESGKIVRRTWYPDADPAFYIMDEKNLSNFGEKYNTYEVLHTFKIKLNETRLFLIRYEPE